MFKKLTLILLFISTLLFAENKISNDVLEYRIKQLEKKYFLLQVQYENNIKDKIKLESQIEILKNKNLEEKENYKNLLANNENLYSSQLNTFNIILVLIGALFFFLSFFGYLNIKKKIESTIDNKIDNKANQKIQEIEELKVALNSITELYENVLHEYEQELEKIKEKSPDNFTEQDKKTLDSKVQKLINKKDKTDDDWYLIGLEYTNKGHYEKAIKAYLNSNNIKPLQENVLINLAHSYNRIGEYDSAIHWLNKAKDLYPNNELIYENLSHAYGSLKDYNQTIQSASMAIELNPNNVVGYNNLGYCYLEMNNLTEAEKYLKKALEIDSNYELAKENLELLKERLNEE